MRYPKYKDSGIEWIGEIPEHWKIQRLKWNAIFEYGNSLSSLERKEGKIPVFGSNGITGFHDKPLTKAPCLIVGRKGSFGKVNWSDKECFPIDTTYFIDETKTDNSLRWLYYLLPNLGLDLFSKDTGVPGLNREDAHNNLIPIPSPEEQTAIANYLDRKTAEIDELIAKKERLLELYEEEKTAVINELVTGKKVWDGNAWTEPAEVKDSGIEWLGRIPAHWEVKKLKYVLKKNKGALKTGPFGSQLKNSELNPLGEYKVYTQRNVLDNDYLNGNDRIDENKFISLKEFEIHPSDILFTTRGTIGKCSAFPKEAEKGILHPCLIRIQIDGDIVITDWIINFVNNSSFFIENVKLESNSTVIDVIYGGTLKEIVFPIPPSDEQTAIVAHIEKERARIDAKIEKTKKLIDLLKEYRTALISEAVTGKIKVVG